MTKVKICGITNLSDALKAAELGADALGFILYEKSPRFIKKEVVREIVSSLPPFISLVGVFVNEREEKIKEICHFCNLGIIQLHGEEDPDFCSRFSNQRKKGYRGYWAI